VIISINNNSFDLLKKNADAYLNSISEEEQNIIITSKIIANDTIEVANIIKIVKQNTQIITYIQ